MKNCNGCDTFFSEDSFYKSSKGYLDSLCKNCRKEYSKNWKNKNKKTCKIVIKTHAKCTKCNKVLKKNTNNFYFLKKRNKFFNECISCNKDRVKKYKKENEIIVSERNKAYQKIKHKEISDNLKDYYIAKLISDTDNSLKIKDIIDNKELISLWREQLKLKREIKKWKSTINTQVKNTIT